VSKLILSVILFFSCYAYSQTLTGTISDSQTGESLFGATVYLTNQNTGTKTEFDGTFKIDLLSGGNKIEFRYIGYENKIIDLVVTSDTNISVKLTPKTQELDGLL